MEIFISGWIVPVMCRVYNLKNSLQLTQRQQSDAKVIKGSDDIFLPQKINIKKRQIFNHSIILVWIRCVSVAFYHSMVYGLPRQLHMLATMVFCELSPFQWNFRIFFFFCLFTSNFFSVNICLICLRRKLYHLQWIYCLLLSRANRKK